MALYLDLKEGECLEVGDAEIHVVKKSGNKTRLQIEADRDKVKIKLHKGEQSQRIWDGPPIFQRE